MKLCILCFTQTGRVKAEEMISKQDEIQKLLENVLGQKEPIDITCFAKGKFLQETKPLYSYLKDVWDSFDAFVFIGACGIAVRSIAPFLKNKWEDPAVLVLDEKASFCISLLSGHVGGANELCVIIAKVMHATPVITTATDVNHIFSVDVFATKNKLFLSSRVMAKEVSAYLLQNKMEEPMCLYDDYHCFSKEQYKDYQEKFLRLGIRYTNDISKIPHVSPLGIYLTTEQKASPFEHTLYLFPKNLSLGVGAKKGIKVEQVKALFEEILTGKGWKKEMFSSVCSIDLKDKEEGILAFCKEYAYEYQTYSKEALCSLSEANSFGFSKSEFVKKTTGVDCVCERSAFLHQKTYQEIGTCLLLQKQAKDGVTMAVAATKASNFVF